MLTSYIRLFVIKYSLVVDTLQTEYRREL